MVTGILAARNAAGEQHDVWAVNVEDAYHEEVLGEPEELRPRLVPRPMEERPLEDLLSSAFARYDPVALGSAVGSVGGASLFLATALLLIRGDEPLGPTLSLLGHYLIGYQVSWGGAILGLLEAGIGGFVFGYALARVINLLVEFTELSVIRECQLSRTLDPLDSGLSRGGSQGEA